MVEKPEPVRKGFVSICPKKVTTILMIIVKEAPKDSVQIKNNCVYIGKRQRLVLNLTEYHKYRAEAVMTDIFNIIVYSIMYNLNISTNTKQVVVKELINYGLEVLPQNSHESWKSLKSCIES